MRIVYNPGFCVTCPKCGKVQLKSNTTDSVIICGRCSFEYYAYMKSGILIEMPAAKLEDSGLARRAPVWTRMVAELIRTGVNYCISVPTRAHDEYLRDTGQDVPWHEVPEEYWINAAAQAGLVI